MGRFESGTFRDGTFCMCILSNTLLYHVYVPSHQPLPITDTVELDSSLIQIPLSWTYCSWTDGTKCRRPQPKMMLFHNSVTSLKNVIESSGFL
jgi:hypothetical protein